jgi:uncharacterized protein (TIGR03437 family)
MELRRAETILLLLLAYALSVTSVLGQQPSGPYWQYVRTDSGSRPYGTGCYPDILLSAAEGAVRTTINSCSDSNPPRQTSYLFEWGAPPKLLAAGQPVDFKLKLTVTANSVPTWTVPAGLGACFENYASDPAISGCSAAVNAFGNLINAGATFVWDNLTRPAGDQTKAPPTWWATDPRYADPTGLIRFNVKVGSSSTYWWSYVYRLVQPKAKVTAAVNGASSRPGIASGSWVTLFGELLSEKSRMWAAGDFSSGRLPTVLDGVQVTIDGKSAYIYYISPGQLNVLAPDGIGAGQVKVEVKNWLGSSETFTALSQRTAPGAFVFEAEGGRHIIAHNPDGAFLAKANIVPGLSTRPARPDEVFTMYVTGLGPTNPATPAERVLAAPAPTLDRVSVRIANLDAEVLWSGKVGSGLYQLNLRVPAAVPSGEQPLVVEQSGYSSPAGTVLTIQR